MEVVRYKPGEAIRWLQTGADSIQKNAKERGKSAAASGSPDFRSFAGNIATMAGALFELGKGAYTDLLHRQAEASEYVLLDNHFDIISGSAIKSVAYNRVQAIEIKGDRVYVMLDQGSVTIKPFAHIVAGRVKVPIGWSRNGMDVPYELLIEELAARCKREPALVK